MHGLLAVWSQGPEQITAFAGAGAAHTISQVKGVTDDWRMDLLDTLLSWARCACVRDHTHYTTRIMGVHTAGSSCGAITLLSHPSHSSHPWLDATNSVHTN